MAEVDPSETLCDFQAWVGRHKVQGSHCTSTGVESDENSWFVPFNDLEAYFTKEKILELLSAVFPSGTTPRGLEYTTILNRYKRVFAILLLIQQGKLIERFLPHDDLCDKHLCFDPLQRPTNFPSGPATIVNIYESFCQHQHKFWNPPMRVGNDRLWPPEVILPFKCISALGKGGTASTQRVEVHAYYNRLLETESKEVQDMSDPLRNTFVIKTYVTPDAKRYYTREMDAFLRIKQQARRKTGLINYYGSFRQAGTFNLILEFANEGTLADYLKKVPAPTVEQTLDFWTSMIELLNALHALHQVSYEHTDPNDAKFEGLHQDVKLENILVSSRGCTSMYSCRFKLADLALCRFKPVRSGTNMIHSRDIGGTRTYGAPECSDRQTAMARGVSQGVDIWSVGCVFSETATWAWSRK